MRVCDLVAPRRVASRPIVQIQVPDTPMGPRRKIGVFPGIRLFGSERHACGVAYVQLIMQHRFHVRNNRQFGSARNMLFWFHEARLHDGH